MTATRRHTVGGMRSINHIDCRRRLVPRDYLTDPHRFGTDPTVAPAMPTGGDADSARIAAIQHRLVCRWRETPDRPSGAALARRFGFSRQVFSRAVRGERWLGETVLCALLAATAPRQVSR